jgi:LCP family protein required for cell wall assembly
MDKKFRIAVIFLLTSITITSCNGTGIFDVSAGMRAPNPVTGLGHTETPTPFLPLSPTGTIYASEGTASVPTPAITPTPTFTDPWGDFPGPTRESAIAIDPPVQQINFPENVVNILLLGSDEAPHRFGHRTDTIMILSIHPDSKRVTILSIPRDLFVYIPGWRVDRINVADTFGGIEMVYQTILYNFGIEIDYWVRANFKGFVEAVNHLGGINVKVGSYLYDECGGVYYEYYPGTYSMDGQTALCYVRMRKTTSDFHRILRQQEVLQAVFQKVLSLDGLTKIPQLYGEFNQWVEGDIELTDLLPLIPMASDLASGKATFESYSISGDLVNHWTMPLTGAQVLLPNRDKIRELLSKIYPY